MGKYIHTVKIECSFEMGKKTPLGVPFILLLTVHYTNTAPKSSKRKTLFVIEFNQNQKLK